MGTCFEELSDRHMDFIRAQKIFFVGTATADSRVSVSPKGLDTLIVQDKKTVVWLNLTGSGNETAAHLAVHPRMTVMFCAFEGQPLILRLYGTADVFHPYDKDWDRWCRLFPPLPGARQVFVLHVDKVQTSCGCGVPLFDYRGDRDELDTWLRNKGEDGIRDYWERRNSTSIDGLPTYIINGNKNP